ncbi:MAG TPA: glycoside hydrolase family 3 N-terminal domain-containing protein [Dinghuibacter sp.]|uniref:glycoside hydrolase family 3 C-terminal domain-containing protein n=1 Tax=Dinghuibacter sp. TaxID=2024697 RepID=UPI002C8008CD|nr:glycoside hydrolase family 3 N-terminal domain-containing protein [Dinghuibacter sp.]HTJ14709.1 glycoside hydrolase family 3 N-terminal domain-containing protein [Dinghuibacter sp.]
MKRLLLLLLPATAFGQNIYQDPHQTADARAADLLHRLSLQEKISLLGFVSPGVPSLSIPRYVWWNEGLHGVARAGEATVFPQAIGAAATFDDGLLRHEADAISTEARAKYNLSVALGRRQQYLGLTFWSPNINIFRDPRWGRGQETYGEDPYLTGRMGAAFVRGIQGTDPNYLKAAACAKHFAVHSGPESGRHSFNARISGDDLRETYLPAFHTLVDSGVEAVMCAYNRVNDQPCCTGRTLLKDILRNEWGFKGHVVTDCGALDDIWERHKVMPDRVTVAAEAIKASVNMDCSDLLQDEALAAVQKGLITEADVDRALTPNLRTAFRLGLYDASGPYSGYGADSVANDYHRSLTRRMAAESMVLLKNDGALPLAGFSTILVTGSNATNADALLGNYHGISSRLVTFVEGITAAAGPACGVEYDPGCDPKDTVHFGGTWVASNSDVIVAVIGLTPQVEGEEGDAFLSDAGADRKTLGLPVGQIAFIKALRRAAPHKRIIAVVTGGSAMDLSSIDPYVNAVLLAWYPGQEGGNALADILFGKVSPSGHLPVTFYKSLSDLPAYDNYAMTGRTYRYFGGEVAYPFGFGLTYGKFSYEWLYTPSTKAPTGGWIAYPPSMGPRPIPVVARPQDTIYFSVSLLHEGPTDADEVIQVYAEYPSVTGKPMPLRELKDFKRVHVPRKDNDTAFSGGGAVFALPVTCLRKWDDARHAFRVYPGKYRIVIGGNSRDERLTAEVVVK